MMKLRSHLFITAVAIGLIGGGLTATGIAIATTPSPTYTACVSTLGGIVYNVTTNGTPTCAGRDKTITWNQTGPQGLPGTNGTNGNTILNGTGAPAAGVGNNGDFYLDTATDTLYGPKTGGAWPATGTSLVGPTGVAYNCSANPYPGIDFAYCLLANENWTDANLAGADLAGASLNNVNLDGAILTGANLTDISLLNINLTGARLEGVNGLYAFLYGANLTGASLVGANLTSGDLAFANLTNADLSQANLTNVPLTNVTWSDTTCPDNTISDNDGGTCANNL